MQNILPIKTVIAKTFKLVIKKEYLPKFLIIGTILSGATYLTNFLYNYFINLSIDQFSPILVILSLFLLTFLYLYFLSFMFSFIYNFCLDVSIESFQSIKKHITNAYNTSFKMLGTIILYGIVLFLGTVLFIIPGLIWGIKYFFAPIISSIEGKKPKEALKESRILTKGYFWQILVRLAIFYIVSSFPGMILSLISPSLNFLQVFFLPITSLFYVILYKNLKYKNQINQQPLQNVQGV